MTVHRSARTHGPVRRAGLRGLAAPPRRVRTTGSRHGRPIAPSRHGRPLRGGSSRPEPAPDPIRGVAGRARPPPSRGRAPCPHGRGLAHGARAAPPGPRSPLAPRGRARAARPPDRRMGDARDGSHGPDRRGGPRDGGPEAATRPGADPSCGSRGRRRVRAVHEGARRRPGSRRPRAARARAWTTPPWKASSTSLKVERVHHRVPATRAEARRDPASGPGRGLCPRGSKASTTPTASPRRRAAVHPPPWSAARHNRVQPPRAGSPSRWPYQPRASTISSRRRATTANLRSRLPDDARPSSTAGLTSTCRPLPRMVDTRSKADPTGSFGPRCAIPSKPSRWRSRVSAVTVGHGRSGRIRACSEGSSPQNAVVQPGQRSGSQLVSLG